MTSISPFFGQCVPDIHTAGQLAMTPCDAAGRYTRASTATADLAVGAIRNFRGPDQMHPEL
jgi:hypothetical protein